MSPRDATRVFRAPTPLLTLSMLRQDEGVEACWVGGSYPHEHAR